MEEMLLEGGRDGDREREGQGERKFHHVDALARPRERHARVAKGNVAKLLDTVAEQGSIVSLPLSPKTSHAKKKKVLMWKT